MPQFTYTAKQGPHKSIDGVVEAAHLDEAIAKITQLGYVPIDVRSRSEKRKAAATWMTRPLFQVNRRVNSADLMLFTRQASDLVDAGVPVLQMLRIILKQTRHPALKELLEKVADAVKDGGALSEALAQHPQVFPKLYVNMIHSGELGGNLGMVLARLAEFLERDQETKSQVKSSLLYPVIVLGVAVLTIVGLFVFVVPRITAIFEDLNQTLPWPTLVIMGISDFFQKFWWLLVLFLVGIGLYVRQLMGSDRGKMWFDQMQLKLPFLGNFIRTAEVARFSRSLGTLLESGVVIVPALESVGSLMENAVIKAGVKGLAQDVANGESLTTALQANPVFPEAAISMVAVGEESGQLSRGLYKLADYYERQTQRFIKRLTSLIEPVLILFLGLIVGFIFVGMLLPILQMNLVIK